MARIANINLPNNKRIVIALTAIFGVGPTLSLSAINKAGINKDKKTKDLTDDEVNKLRLIIEKEYNIEGELKREISSNIKRLKEVGSYRGSRHAKNLPMRGQRTKTNARTRKGKKKFAGSGKKSKGQKT
jgi:small subunit ribosomal protein S13